jgi:serine protease Do
MRSLRWMAALSHRPGGRPRPETRRNLGAGIAAIAGVLLALSAPGLAQQADSATPSLHGEDSKLIRDLLPSVVSIVIEKDAVGAGANQSAAGGMPQSSQAYGSGFIIDPSGLIATNYHVVQGAWEIEVGFHDGTRVLAHLVKATQLVDVALIKVDVGHPLPAVRWGSSEALQVGDPVIAIGNALGVGISVTRGIVSALHRNIDASPYDDFIQTDAAINHGNSGGPLFDLKGEVVGIDTALISPSAGSSGLGFAIPSRSAQIIIDRLLRYGWLRPGWIGVKIEEVTPDMAQALSMPQAEGSVVAYVQPGGPAETAGLRVGDVIVSINNAASSDERALLRTIATTPIGQEMTLALWREGKPVTLTVTVHEWPRALWEKLDPPIAAAGPEPVVPQNLGIALAPLTDDDRARPGFPGKQTGVRVTSVAKGSDAAQRGLAAGDIILRVQNRAITNVVDLQEALAAARAAKLQFVMVLTLPKIQKLPAPEWVVLRVSDG